MNPLGKVPIFIAFTARESRVVQRLVAFFVALTALGIGINIVNGVEVNPTGLSIDASKAKGNWTKAKSVYQQIVIPRALPLLIGPGANANAILYAREIEARGQSLLNLELFGVTILLSLAVMLILRRHGGCRRCWVPSGSASFSV
jgi:small neutral amino acid transporter SnatA (MarC family)